MERDRLQTIKAFIKNFVSDEFFIDLIKVGLYPSGFGNSIGGTTDTTTHIKKFFNDLKVKCLELKIPNTRQLQRNIALSNTIFNIRDSEAGIINYDNVYQHLPSIDVSQQRLIQDSISNKINDINEFRTNIDVILRKIQVYYEVSSISQSIILMDNFSDYVSQTDVSVFEAAKIYKENVIRIYNDLSKLQSVAKNERESDYVVIKDKDSTNKFANTVVDHISNGYSFFKTGFTESIDKPLDGFESSSVHVLAAPSNHGKSLALINLERTIILENIKDFQENDAIIFVSLEDKIILSIIVL